MFDEKLTFLFTENLKKIINLIYTHVYFFYLVSFDNYHYKSIIEKWIENYSYI